MTKSLLQTLKFKTVTAILFIAIKVVLFDSVAIAQNLETSDTALFKRLYKLHTNAGLLHSPKLASRFYQYNNWQPVWINRKDFTSVTHQLLSQLKTADHDGLVKSIYHIDFLDSQLKPDHTADSETSIKLDLLLTDAYLTYSDHLLHGYLRPDKQRIDHQELDLVATLNNALSVGNIKQSFFNFYPDVEGYNHLRKALSDYRKIESNYKQTTLQPGSVLELNDQGPHVSLLKEKLVYFDGPINTSGDIFDQNLDLAVRRFQQRHGLEVDGIVGPQTLTELNVSIKQRIKQIEINMDRLRWLPRDPGKKYIIVNIPDFSLTLIENKQIDMTSRIIVGKKDHETPVFSKNMTYLVLNPYWFVPNSIAVNEFLPTLVKDTDYLNKHNLRVFDKQTGQQVSPVNINWQQVSKNSFPYRFRQDTGPTNAMGKVKFIFPNTDNIYLHDTPSKNLFARNKRNFSHGCIRVEKAIKLAKHLLKEEPTWDSDHINNVLKTEKQKVVNLESPVPVHIIYHTAWVSEGMVQFRQDLYGRNEKLLAELKRIRR